MNDCEQLRELIPAYSIGATDADETRLVEDGLKRCPELVAELNYYADISDKISDSIPMMPVPTHLLGDLLMSAKKSRPKPVYHLSWAKLAVASLLLLLVLSNIYWITRLNTATIHEIDLQTAVNGEVTRANGHVIWSQQSGDAILIVSDFPILPNHQVYQAWVRRDADIISLGIFSVNDDGAGTLIFASDVLSHPFDTLGVTIEPLGGSHAPTSSPVVRWQSS